MSKADEMFEKLGYKKEVRKYADVYNKHYKDINMIRQFGFNTKSKAVMIDVEYITMQELQAINEKVKELGWEV
jgi:uncharacterized protein YlbG (UPF0298 family)